MAELLSLWSSLFGSVSAETDQNFLNSTFPRYFPALNGGTGFLCGLLLLCVGVGGAWFWFWFCSGAHDQPAAVPPHNWVREHLIQDGSTKISSPPCHPWIRLTRSGRLQASRRSIKKFPQDFPQVHFGGVGLHCELRHPRTNLRTLHRWRFPFSLSLQFHQTGVKILTLAD